MPRRRITGTGPPMTTLPRQIPPPKSSSGVIILLTVLLFSVVPFSSDIHPWAVALSIVLLVVSMLFRATQATHITCFTAGFTLMPFLFPFFRSWPFALLVPFFLYLVAVLMVPSLRTSLYWTRAGRLNGEILAMVIVTAMISGIALYLWNRLLKPDLSVHLSFMPDMPIWLYPLAGLGFSVGNAVLEESVFRGMFMQALDSVFGPGLVSVVVQAWLFGAIHYMHGFPNGAWGIAMTFVYGIILGVIRRRGHGMLAPMITHACADMAVFAILTSLVMGSRG
jgi:membrane protease YdiL (CAAX protease family)